MVKRKNHSLNRLFIPGVIITIGVSIVAVSMFRGYIDQKRTNLIRKSGDQLVAHLRSADFSNASTFERCDKDYSNKFDTSYSCGLGVEIKDDTLNENDFNRLLNSLADQDIFHTTELFNNIKLEENRRSTYSKATVGPENVECSISLSYGYTTRPSNFHMELWCDK